MDKRHLEERSTAQEHLELYLKEVYPKNAIDVEREILVCMLSDNSYIEKSLDLIPEMFMNERYREIFISVRQLFRDDCPVNEFTISTNMKQRNVNVGTENILDDVLDKPFPVHYEKYIKILQYNFVAFQFYKLVCLAPLILGDEADIDSFIDMAKPVLIPLNKTLFDTFERPTYKEHWITNGATSYFVYKNKYGPDGYVWVDGKIVNEYVLLSTGFKRIYTAPD